MFADPKPNIPRHALQFITAQSGNLHDLHKWFVAQPDDVEQAVLELSNWPKEDHRSELAHVFTADIAPAAET